MNDAGHHVEGLVFLLTPKDEMALDRFEGVSSERGSSPLYLKQRRNINFDPHESFVYIESSELAK